MTQERNALIEKAEAALAYADTLLTKLCGRQSIVVADGLEAIRALKSPTPPLEEEK